MTDVLTRTMQEIRQAPLGGDLSQVDCLISAALEALPDMLTTSGPKDLEGALREVRATLGRFEGDSDETKAAFVSGRLSAMVDLLGYAATQTADPSVIAFAKSSPYIDILEQMADDAQRNVDLVRNLGRDKALISKWLSALRGAGLVSSHRRGRELYNTLTPLARSIVPAPKKNEA